jgi:hypothetical protein
MLRTLLASLLVLGAAPFAVACGADSTALVDVKAIAVDHLEIVRGDQRIADTTVQALQELPATTREHKGTHYRGVRLRDLLRAQGVDPAELSGVEAIAADGYSALLSGDELRADTTIIAHEADDAALRDESGPLRLVTDERDHSVRQLRRLRLR